jgi:hypothetical protein
MKTIHVSRTLLGSVLAGLVFLPGAASAYTLSFSPSTQNVGSGSSATVDVRIAGIFPGTPNEDDGLGAYDFDVVYDPAIIRFKKATDGFSLGTSVGLGVDDNGQSGSLIVQQVDPICLGQGEPVPEPSLLGMTLRRSTPASPYQLRTVLPRVYRHQVRPAPALLSIGFERDLRALRAGQPLPAVL